jgi:hypothetical protein
LVHLQPLLAHLLFSYMSTFLIYRRIITTSMMHVVQTAD